MITNNSGICVALAVWLLHDEYDHIKGVKKYISATTLMKPLRHIILSKRVPPEAATADVEDFISRALGSSLHDSIEKAWTVGYARSLKLLGYSQSMIDRIRVNPTLEECQTVKDIIPVFLEQRMFREFMGFTIGGKFDQVTEGIINDTKSTSAYSWVFGGKDDDYKLQTSIYRWLDSVQPHVKITEDHARINFIFTDWQKLQARTNPAYPQKRVEHKDIPLMSLEETEQWIKHKLFMIDKYWDAPEADIPECTDEELWRSEPAFKYYADPLKTDGKSSKNFDKLSDAHAHMAAKGGKGIVKTVPSEPKRCEYCEAYLICTQKDRYFTS